MSESISIPCVLQPRMLRHGVVQFQNLKSHIFSRDEIIQICKEFSRESEPWKYQVTSINALSKRYNIHVDGLRNWKVIYDAKHTLSFESTYCSMEESPMDKIGLKRILAWQLSVDRETLIFLRKLLFKNQKQHTKEDTKQRSQLQTLCMFNLMLCYSKHVDTLTLLVQLIVHQLHTITSMATSHGHHATTLATTLPRTLLRSILSCDWACDTM